ncbi:hypothetical protein vBYenM636_71 [Yersinia phage vB_YenM_636]|nr:hypothetical protein vBYenM12_71 [Yersinia phage vB_YenM_12]QKN86413.1 hypothetical protein vBYenM22_71 [Yersinia phage vB_YenM_22]QKN86504.1 hypothetical protein vBYenM25_71 [Yersinia phage vB_YenM_25]QKN86595.1 hypothetical protein vBYenM27_71 [Yersinia phage vB_YenM_27]QKN86686.1 hypothetical protein vBYenM39_71 [Yersinia phage vB_YenM_39]QKN86777.1 hypothetical protein vBYenM126_71 [Yersinia phage vB_YenM_126]QKN86868.1 hypothetical protein vBYenM526-1_71 [Yersinia phage vB_YenM_526-1]
MANNIIIPISSYPDQTFSIELDGIPLQMRVYWSTFNDKMRQLVEEENGPEIYGAWHMDIVGSDIELYGLGIVQGCDIIEPYSIPELGGFFVGNIEGKASEITYDSLGNEHVLMYILKENLQDFYTAIGYRNATI